MRLGLLRFFAFRADARVLNLPFLARFADGFDALDDGPALFFLRCLVPVSAETFVTAATDRQSIDKNKCRIDHSPFWLDVFKTRVDG